MREISAYIWYGTVLDAILIALDGPKASWFENDRDFSSNSAENIWFINSRFFNAAYFWFGHSFQVGV